MKNYFAFVVTALLSFACAPTEEFGQIIDELTFDGAPEGVTVNLPSTVLDNVTTTISRVSVVNTLDDEYRVRQVVVAVAWNDRGGVPLALSNYRIRELGQATDVTGSTVTVMPIAANSAHVVFTLDSSIAFGVSKVYEVRATVAGADISKESVKTRIIPQQWLGATPCSPSLDEECLNPPFESEVKGIDGTLKAQGLQRN